MNATLQSSSAHLFRRPRRKHLKPIHLSNRCIFLLVLHLSKCIRAPCLSSRALSQDAALAYLGLRTSVRLAAVLCSATILLLINPSRRCTITRGRWRMRRRVQAPSATRGGMRVRGSNRVKKQAPAWTRSNHNASGPSQKMNFSCAGSQLSQNLRAAGPFGFMRWCYGFLSAQTQGPFVTLEQNGLLSSL